MYKRSIVKKKELRNVETSVVNGLIKKQNQASTSVYSQVATEARKTVHDIAPFSFVLPTQLRYMSDEEKRRRTHAVWERKKERYRELMHLTALFTKLLPQLLQTLLGQKACKHLASYDDVRHAIAALY